MTHVLTTIEFEIPQRSGEVLCVPPATEFVSLAQHNARLLADTPVQIGGVALAELRRRTRRQALEAATSYTRALGIEPAVLAVDMLLLVTGHQPFLFHPGIWIKHLLVDRLSTAGVAALSIPVDSDAAEEIGADVPHYDQGLRLVRETLLQCPADVPYEALASSAAQVWQEYLARLDAHLVTLPQRAVREAFGAFMQRAATIQGVSDMGAFITVARRRHEGPRRYLELPVSRMTQSPEFQLFFLQILHDSERFAECYNRHLNAYRERYNVRTAAQPFSNLERDGTRIELPFWLLHAGRRRPLFAERQSHSWRLWTEREPVATVRDGAGVDEIDHIPIRPRALTLTAFARLCLADLFVHGVGGGRYDRVTDSVIREYFGLEPPSYAVVTATLHLPLTEFNPVDERQNLQRRMLELQHNPDRVLVAPSSQQQAWIDEKWRLIGLLDGGGLTRRERRQATQRIREINEWLSHALEDERGRIERRLADLTEVSAATAAATHRAYPFCFFPPQAVDDLIESMVSPQTV